MFFASNICLRTGVKFGKVEQEDHVFTPHTELKKATMCEIWKSIEQDDHISTVVTVTEKSKQIGPRC